MKRRFIIRNRSIKENALWAIRELSETIGKKEGEFEQIWDVIIKPYVKPRSDSAHGYYRVLIGMVSEHTGYEKEELHDMFRTKASLWKTVNGVEVLKSTKEMSGREMTDLIDLVIRTAAQDLDLSLPPPIQSFTE